MHAAVLEIELYLYDFHLLVLKISKASDKEKCMKEVNAKVTLITQIIQVKIDTILPGRDTKDIYLTKMMECLTSIINNTLNKPTPNQFTDPSNVLRLEAIHDEFINLCLSYRSKLSAERMEQISTHLEQIVKNTTHRP